MISDNLIHIIHLAGEGKLDKLDMRILSTQSTRSGIGYKSISSLLRVPVSTIQDRCRKIRTLLSPISLDK